MYVVLVYDVCEERVLKVCKYLRMHLDWVQNSVFEGELSTGELIEIVKGLKSLIDIERDSIRIYIINSLKNVKKMHIGKRYKEPSQIM